MADCGQWWESVVGTPWSEQLAGWRRGAELAREEAHKLMEGFERAADQVAAEVGQAWRSL